MIKLTARPPQQFRGDVLVFFVAESGKKQPACRNTQVKRWLKRPWKAGDFRGRKGQCILFYPGLEKGGTGEIAARRVLVVGLGKPGAEQNGLREQLRVAAGTAAARASGLKARELLAVLPEKVGLPPAEVAECISEGLVLANYRFDKYKTVRDEEEDSRPVEKFLLYGGLMSQAPLRRGMKLGRRAAEAACRARDMANEPGNVWTPERFAEYARELADRTSLECEILGTEEMEKLGMGGLLGVGSGSARPPRLILLRYHSRKKNPTLMLVGKGLTFDSGGISLKPAAGMEEMKYDMCGGAAVLCAMDGVARERPKRLNVAALIPAAENLSGSAAIRPGDIITHYGGKTSEVVNTDAEGRLILADALAYGIETIQPDAVIDLATLTGAAIIALGHHRTALLANNDALVQRLEAAGERCGEPLWRLPLGREYTRQLESKVADLKNVGGRPAGTITAAAYLQEFVGDVPWAHLDIAGTAWNFTKKSYVPEKGPSGIGVRTLLELIRHWKPL